MQKTNKQGVINRDVNAAQRATQAVALRAQKLTFEQIAAKCGYGSAGAARNAIMRELQRTMVKQTDELRMEELSILDRMHAEVWALFIEPKNKGRLFALDRLLAISDARRKLMGLDVPKDGNIAAAQVVVRELPPNYLDGSEAKSE